MIDIVIPNNNEKEFVKMAKKLGIKGLIFLYKNPKKIEIKSFDTRSALLAENQKAMQKSSFIVARSERKFIENKKPKIILIDETKSQKDKVHQRNSGLNETLCKIAKKSKKTFAISFNHLLKAKDPGFIFGRQVQNARLLRKFKNKVVIASFATTPYEMKAPKDLIAYAETLGFHPSEAKQTLNQQL